MLPILQFWKALPITYSENQSELLAIRKKFSRIHEFAIKMVKSTSQIFFFYNRTFPWVLCLIDFFPIFPCDKA